MAGGTGIFLIDSAADVNAIKSGVLAASVTIDSSHIVSHETELSTPGEMTT